MALPTTLRGTVPTGDTGHCDDPPSETSHDSTASRRISALLRKAFTLVDNDPKNAWARKFLFSNSPDGTIQMLTNHAAIRNAVTIQAADTCFTTDSTSSSPSMPPGIHDRNLDVDALLIPSFSEDELSVGVVVQRLNASPSAPAPGFKHSIGRFVRNDVTGELLIFKSTAASDGSPTQAQIVHLRHLSTCRRERTVVLCRPEVLGKSCSLDIAENVLMASHSVESRFCPQCGASPGMRCSCRFALAKSQHKFDYGNNFHCMKSHIGSFMGSTTSTMIVSDLGSCPEVPPVEVDANTGLSAQALCLQQHPILPSHVYGASSVFDQRGVQKQYTQAALMSRVSMNCFSRYCPGEDDAHTRISGLLQTFALQLHVDSSDPVRAIFPSADCVVSTQEFVPALEDRRMDRGRDEVIAEIAGIVEFVHHEQVHQPRPQQSQENQHIQLQQHSQEQQLVQKVAGNPYSPKYGCFKSPPAPQTPALLRLSSSEEDEDVCSDFEMEIDVGPLDVRVDMISGLDDAPNCHFPSLLPGESGEISIFPYQPPPIGIDLPDSTIAGCMSSEISVDAVTSEVGACLDEVTVTDREELRRHKNRLAAARSNARRKALNDGLKKKVRDRRETIQRLEKWRDALCLENGRLKVQVEEKLRMRS
jgi:hypothetical protein